jgi:hypothetical protein
MVVTPKEYALVIAFVAVKVVHSFPFVVNNTTLSVSTDKIKSIYGFMGVFLITLKDCG